MFRIVDIDDETREIHLNGEELITLTHDEHGWAAMEDIENLIENIARILNIPIENE